VFQVEILKTGAGMSDRIQFRYLSGDRIPTKDLEIVFIAKGVMTEVLPNSDNVNYTFDGTNWTSYTAPWRFIPGERVGSYPEHEFGNYTLAPGTTFKGCYFAGYQGFNGTDDVHAMIKNWDDLTTDDIVTVKIVHTPSGRVIWQAEVPVKG
jgi:FlaG/FlaF family flagellin (archaellin)